MKSASKTATMARAKKIALHRGRASEILASLHVGIVDERRAKSALASVARVQRARAGAVDRKRSLAKKSSGNGRGKATSTPK